MFSFSMLLPLSTCSGAEPVLRLGGLKMDCFLLRTMVDIICPTPWIDLRTFFPEEAATVSAGGEGGGRGPRKDPLGLENAPRLNQRTSRRHRIFLLTQARAHHPTSYCTPSPISKPVSGFLARKSGKHWTDHGKHLAVYGKCLPGHGQGLTCHLVIVDCLHHQLRVLDAVDDAQQGPCQAQQLAEAVEAEVDEVVGKADDLGKDKAAPDLTLLRAEQENPWWGTWTLQEQQQPDRAAPCKVLVTPAVPAPRR